MNYQLHIIPRRFSGIQKHLMPIESKVQGMTLTCRQGHYKTYCPSRKSRVESRRNQHSPKFTMLSRWRIPHFRTWIKYRNLSVLLPRCSLFKSYSAPTLPIPSTTHARARPKKTPWRELFWAFSLGLQQEHLRTSWFSFKWFKGIHLLRISFFPFFLLSSWFLIGYRLIIMAKQTNVKCHFYC